jgi:hypothetical protein
MQRDVLVLMRCIYRANSAWSIVDSTFFRSLSGWCNYISTKILPFPPINSLPNFKAIITVSDYLGNASIRPITISTTFPDTVNGSSMLMLMNNMNVRYFASKVI